MMMTKLQPYRILYLLAFLLVLTSCDSGDIVENDTEQESNGYTVRMNAIVSGMAALSDKYTLALATFKANDNYALTVYSIPSTSADKAEVSIVASNITSDVSTVELVVTNRLRQRVISLASINMADYAAATDTIRMNVGTVEVGMTGIIQRHVFNASCIQCHGGNGGNGAADLNLTEGHALANLKDVASTRKEDTFRIVSGNAGQSLLHRILAEGGEDILHYNHTEVLTSQFKNDAPAVRTFIDDWINSMKKDE